MYLDKCFTLKDLIPQWWPIGRQPVYELTRSSRFDLRFSILGDIWRHSTWNTCIYSFKKINFQIFILNNFVPKSESVPMIEVSCLFPFLPSLSPMPFSTWAKKTHLLLILPLKRFHFPWFKDYGVPNKGQLKILVSVIDWVSVTFFFNDFKEEIVKYSLSTSCECLKFEWKRTRVEVNCVSFSLSFVTHRQTQEKIFSLTFAKKLLIL